MAATAEVVEDLEVRTHKRVRVFAEGAFVPSAEQHVELVVNSNKFGLSLAVLSANRLFAYRTGDLHALEKRNELDPEVTDLKSRTVDYFDENVRISYVHLSCNGRVLAFAVDSPAGSFVHLFDLLAFAPELSAQPFPLTSIRPSADGGRITCLEWNPEAEDVLAVGTADGTVTTFKFSLAAPAAFSIVGSAKLNAAPTCMSWSRKGKQLTVGDRAGRLHQLTPDIKPVRVTDAPQQIQGFAGPFVCAGVFWVATTDWLVAYRQHDDPLKLTLALLTVKKNVPPEWKFFGDVTFQRPNAPPMDTALHFVPLMEWNLVFVYAHRSPDIVVIGQRNGQWVNFVMERFTATMPVDAKKADSYPLGVAIDLSSQVRVVLDRSNPESPVLPPQPAMFVLSSAGLLLSYNVCSLDPVRPQLNTQPIAFSPQDAVNGAPPAGYVPRQPAVGGAQAQATPVAQQPTSAAAAASAPSSFFQAAAPIAAQPASVPAPPAQPPAPTAEELEAERTRKLEAEMEKTLAVYSQNEEALVASMERFGVVRNMIEERAESFDPTCIDELWELLQRVQQSLDDGVYTSELIGRQTAGLSARIRQLNAFFERYKDKKRAHQTGSGLMDELMAADKRAALLQADFTKFETAAQAFLDETAEAQARRQRATRHEVAEVEPIAADDQERINRANDEISRRVARYVRKLVFIQHRVQMLKAYAARRPMELEEKPTTPAANRSADTSGLSADLRRFLLIVDDAPADSPQRNTTRTIDGGVKKQSLGERQEALKRVMTAHAQKPQQVHTVCPKKLVVESAEEATPRWQRTDDSLISRQLAAARNSPIIAPRPPAAAASLSTPPRMGGSLTLGTAVSPVVLLNTAKSASAQQTPQPAAAKPAAPLAALPQPAQQAASTPTIAAAVPQQPKVEPAVVPSVSVEQKPAVAATPPVQPAAAQPAVQPAASAASATTTSTPAAATGGFSFLSKPAEPTAAATASSTVPTVTTTAPVSFSFAPKPATTSAAPAPAPTSVESKPAASFSFATPAAAPSSGGFFTGGASQLQAGANAAKPASSFSFATPQAAAATPAAAKAPVSFSFAPNAAATPQQQPAAPTASPFGAAFGGGAKPTGGDDGMEDDSQAGGSSTTAAASSFSFAGTGLGSTTPQNKPGGGFGGALNWGALTQKAATSSSPFGSPFGGGGSTTASPQTQPQSAQVGSPFGGGASFGSGPSFGTGTAFGGGATFGSQSQPAFKSPFSGASATPASGGGGGFSAFANKGNSFGQLAQQSPQQTGGLFGSPSPASPQQASGVFGSPFGGGATFGGGGATNAFGGGTSAFGGGSTFASQNKSSAFTAFRK